MSHELTLTIPHKAAARLAQALGIVLNHIQEPTERIYFQSLLTQVKDFAEAPPPIYVKVTVIAIDGVPVKK